MRVNQLRAFHVSFDKEEYLPYQVMNGMPPGFVTEININVTKEGAAMITFIGHYFDPLDLEVGDPDPDTNEVDVKPKRKAFRIEQRVDSLAEGPNDPVMQFLGKLNLMRQDELSMERFMSEENPVG